jgi:ABC-type oligopeptide transport system substrate-binding subunit
MGKNFKLFSVIAICLVAALSLSACNFGGKAGKGNEQVLTLPETQEPPSLDSAKSTDAVSGKILNNTMEGLMRIGKDGKLILGMAAEEPKISDDKKTYLFKLRDAKWSDGKPVTAHDFEFAWKRALKPQTASEYAFILYPILNAGEYNKGKVSEQSVGVKALDDKTLKVQLKAATPYFMDLLTFQTYMPQRKDIVEKYGDKFALEANTLVCNGPFVLSEWKHSQSFQYKKNENYWDKEVVKLQIVNTKIVKDNTTSLNLYKTGKLDLTILDAEFMNTYKNNPERFDIKESSSRYIEMNHKKPLFKNKKIRQAIVKAIDTKAMAERILNNGSVPAGALVAPVVKATDAKTFREIAPDHLAFNPTEAKRLWEEGLKELGISNPDKIELLGDDHNVAKKMLTFVKEQLRTNLGANIVITSVPFKQRLVRSNNQQFDLVTTAWVPDYNDPMTFVDMFITGKSFNHGKWSNKEFDSLIKKSEDNPNFEQRMSDLVKAEKILIDDAAIAPICYGAHRALKKPYVKDVIWHAIGPEYSLKWAYVGE